MGKRPNYTTMIFPIYAGPFSLGLSQPWWCPGSREQIWGMNCQGSTILSDSNSPHPLQIGGCIKIGRARKGRNTLGLPKEFGPWIPLLFSECSAPARTKVFKIHSWVEDLSRNLCPPQWGFGIEHQVIILTITHIGSMVLLYIYIVTWIPSI